MQNCVTSDLIRTGHFLILTGPKQKAHGYLAPEASQRRSKHLRRCKSHFTNKNGKVDSDEIECIPRKMKQEVDAGEAPLELYFHGIKILGLLQDPM